MHVSPDQSGRRLRLTIPPEQIGEVVAQLRAIAEAADDPIAATRIRRLMMQLRGQEDEVTIRAVPADILLVLEWGLRGAQAGLETVLEGERPHLAAADAAYARVRWYVDALSQVEELEMRAMGLTPEDVQREQAVVEPIAVARGRWQQPPATVDRVAAIAEPA